MTTLLALLLWSYSYVMYGYLPDHVRPMFPPSCLAYEDGAVICAELVLPAYDELEVID